MDGRDFRPHVSLARGRAGVIEPVDLSGIPLGITVEMDELVLFESKLTGEGSIYTPLLVKHIL